MPDRIKYCLLLVLLAPLFGCAEFLKTDQLNKIVNEPQSIANYDDRIDKNSLYVFVGEKISVEEFDSRTDENQFPMDYAFKAKYKVLQNVYGGYLKDIIEFEVFDHYGAPSFAKHRNVLLFVSEHRGKLYHQKYQYFDVYKTKDGRWAKCGDPYVFEEYHRKPFTAAQLEFEEPLLFDLNQFNNEYKRAVFTNPYFRVNGNKAECLMGLYVEDLFTIKKEGVLKARGLFK